MPGDDYYVEFDPQDYAAGAQKWLAAQRPGGRAPPDINPQRRPSTEQVPEYRALPAGTREQLKTLITEQTPTLVDGRDIQFWDWSNADVASVLVELTGQTEFFVARCLSYRPCMLTRDGWRVHWTQNYGGIDSKVTAGTPRVKYSHAAPILRYPARPRFLPSKPPASSSALHECVKPHVAYTENDFDPTAISDLRIVYRTAMEAISRERNSELNDVRVRRAAARGQWVLVLLVAVVVLVGFVIAVIAAR